MSPKTHFHRRLYSTAGMRSVFISYRRDDAAGHAGRLSDRLAARLGAARVFMDVEDIAPGQNFAQAIEQTLSKCDYLLAVVGPNWVKAIQARMAGGEDFVRHEITAALSRRVTIIPVLVGGATMPTAADLPPELAEFSRCQAVEIRDNRFDDDATRLVDYVAGGRATRRRAIVAIAVLLPVLALGGWFASMRLAPSDPVMDGVWVADVRKPGQREYRVRFTLALDNDRVTGMVQYPTGEGPILDGRISNDRLTFRTSHVPQFADGPATIWTEATVEGDQLTLKMTDDNGTATGVARRSTDRGGQTRSTDQARELPSLAYGTWTLRNARDDQQKRWDNSVLQFTTQEETPDGLLLRGRFTWRLDNQLIGSEEFTGRYVERSRQVILEGDRVTDPDRLAVGSYSAVLARDERTLVQGRWGSTAQHEPGHAGEWEAVR
jgi:hypothetical protein